MLIEHDDANDGDTYTDLPLLSLLMVVVHCFLMTPHHDNDSSTLHQYIHPTLVHSELLPYISIFSTSCLEL